MAAFDARKWPNHPSAIFLQWPELAVEFAAKNFSAVQDANSSDLLVLDDIGADNDPWSVARDMLCQILSRRERKFTVVTTNIQMQDWAEKFDVRINDRLMRNSIIVDLSNVPSYSNQ